MHNKLKGIILIAIPLLFVFFLYKLGMFDSIMLSKYNGRTFNVTSNDGRISGTIKTVVKSCGEFESCVYVDYNLILNDDIPPNKNEVAPDKYFNPNYYYVANIFNNSFVPEKPSYDANLEPADNNFPSNKFSIKFTRILYNYYYSPDDFLKLRRLEIYDVSDPANVNSKLGFIDDLEPLKNSVQFRSYDFTVTPQ